MKILICGGRDFKDVVLFVKVMRSFLDTKVPPGTRVIIVTGCASGADEMARTYADLMNLECHVHYARWKALGRAAGPLRNTEMIKEQPDWCVAFPGTRGTANMVMQARAAGVPVHEVNFVTDSA